MNCGNPGLEWVRVTGVFPQGGTGSDTSSPVEPFAPSESRALHKLRLGGIILIFSGAPIPLTSSERCFEGWKTDECVESVITRLELEELGERYKSVAGFNVERVNEKIRRTAKVNGYSARKTVIHESGGMENIVE